MDSTTFFRQNPEEDFDLFSEVESNPLEEQELEEDYSNTDEVPLEFLDSWNEEELTSKQIVSRSKQDEIYFTPASNVSDYETVTKVEFKINSWKSLTANLDLRWVEKKNYKLVESMSELQMYLKEMNKARFVAFDTETTGLNIYNLNWNNPLKDHIVGCSLSWKVNQGIYIPFRHKKFGNLPLAQTLKLLKPILEKKDLILHNAIFDYRVMYDLGIKLNVAHDTMSLLFHIDSRVARGGKALKDNIKRIFGIDTLDLETMTGSGRYAAKFDTLDKRTCEVYGCADTDFALSLLLYLIQFLDERSYSGYLEDIAMIPVLAKMEYFGRRVDTTQLPRFNEINNTDINKLKDLIYKYVGTYINRKNGIDRIDSYIFNLNSADDLSNVMYNILEMPILSVSEKTGKPQTNTHTFKTLLAEGATEPDPILMKLLNGDVLSGYAKLEEETGIEFEDDRFLIKWKKISVTKYPFVYLLKELRKRIKLKTAYFEKLMNSNYEGKYFTSASLTAAETHRIIDVAQTIPAFLKLLFIPFDDTQYLLDCDYAQIEARVFSSLAGMQNLVERLTLPWADFHRESGAAIFGKKPEDISKEERGSLKTVNFGLPFKMGPGGLVNFKYGLVPDKELKKKYTDEMKILVRKWNTANKPVADMLNDYRRKAVTICKEEKVLNYFGDVKVGKIYNAAGRARVFNLDGVVDDQGNIIDNSKAEAIYRQAGNFPIQGYAAHLYRVGVLNMMKKLQEDKLIDIKVKDPDRPLGYKFFNMVYLTATVHDESLLIIDGRINPDYMVELIADQAMLHIEGHAPYYMGISFAHDWHEGHSGSTEMSVEFVYDLLERRRQEAYEQGLDRIPILRTTNENPRDKYIEEMAEFQKKQIILELLTLNKDTLNKEGGKIIIRDMMKRFSNYTLKAIVKDVPSDKKILDQILNLITDQSGDKVFNCKLVASMLTLYAEMYDYVNTVEVEYDTKGTVILNGG